MEVKTEPRRKPQELKLVLTFIPGSRPEVEFTGFWTAKFLKIAMNGLAKAYRLHRRDMARPRAEVVDTQLQPKREKEVEDGRSNR